MNDNFNSQRICFSFLFFSRTFPKVKERKNNVKTLTIRLFFRTTYDKNLVKIQIHRGYFYKTIEFLL